MLPRWSGETLDLVVDFLTYVFVPAYAIAASGLLPTWFAIPAGVIVCITGALYFADRDDEDRGQLFPRFSGGVESGGVLSLSARAAAWIGGGSARRAGRSELRADPVSCIRCVCRRWRRLNIALLGAWAVLAIVAVAANLQPGLAVTIPLSLIAIYFFAAGLLRRHLIVLVSGPRSRSGVLLMPVLLIAGGSRGIGAATARLAARDAATTSRSTTRRNAKAARRRRRGRASRPGGKPSRIAGDMAHRGRHRARVRRAAEALGPLTHFVHSVRHHRR